MATQRQLDESYMGDAINRARLSRGIRAKVGACLVTNNGVTLTGYNGTPSGADNALEIVTSEGTLTTKPEVIHAELNCVLKAAREGVSCVGGTIYITLSPCVPCAAMLVQAGIKRVVYMDKYRDNAGIDYLKNMRVDCEQLNIA